MATLEENVLSLYNTSKQVLDRATGEFNAREAKLNTALADFNSKVVAPTFNIYDGLTNSKLSLNIVASPDDPTMSNWVAVPQNSAVGGDTKANFYQYYTEGSLCIVNTNTCYSYPPGYNETPQYTTDKSITLMQFILANETATSAQINDRLTTLGLDKKIPNHGGWWEGSAALKTTAICVPGLQLYSRLFVRFVNVPYGVPELTTGQEIVTYGGNAAFSVNNVISYPSIKFI